MYLQPSQSVIHTMDNMDILVQLGLDLNTSDFSRIEHLTYDEEGVHDNFTHSGIFYIHCLQYQNISCLDVDLYLSDYEHLDFSNTSFSNNRYKKCNNNYD